MAEEQDPLIGVMVRDYILERQLGRGAMGLVYLARHCATKNHVAVKFLSGEFAAKKEFVTRFMNEAAACAQMQHDNIVRVFEAGQDDGTYFMVMEFVDGVDLAHFLEVQDKVKERQVLPWLKQAATALSYAHSQGIVHRDLKPENIMLTKDGMIKVADLGLSKNIGVDDNFSMTMSGTVIGTPYYISPEQARDAKHVDPRTDMYSLGATFYHLVTGYPPFQGNSAAEVMAKHMNEQLTYPQRKNTSLSDGLSDVIMKMMEKEPAKRFQNMEELTQAIERLERGESVIVKKVKLRQTEETPSQIRARTHWKPPKWLIRIAAVVLVIAAAWWYLQPSKPPTDNAKPPPSHTPVPPLPGNVTPTSTDPGHPPVTGSSGEASSGGTTENPTAGSSGSSSSGATENPPATDPGGTSPAPGPGGETPPGATNPPDSNGPGGGDTHPTTSAGTAPPVPPVPPTPPEDPNVITIGPGKDGGSPFPSKVPTAFNWVDIFGILAIVGGVLAATPIGWMWATVRAVLMWVAIVLVFMFFGDIAGWLKANAAVPESTAMWMSFLITSMVGITAAFVLSHKLQGHKKETWKVKLDRLIAIAPGLVLGGAFAAWLMALLAVMGTGMPVDGSWIGSRVLNNFPAVQKAVDIQLKESKTPGK